MAEILKEKDPSDDDEEQLIIVETPPTNDSVPTDADTDDDDDDDRPAARRAEAEPEGDTDAEREAIRERRRQEKLERKTRRDEAIRRDKLEMDFLRKRNDDLERRLTLQEQRSVQVDLNTIDTEIARARQEKDMAERVIAKAVAAGNGEDVAQALKYRDDAAQREQQLTWQKQQRMAVKSQPTEDGLDPRVKRLANQFMANNKWYNPAGEDEDSAIVIALDQTLAREGFDPATPDYWDELTDRVRRRLPEKFSAQTRDDPPPPRTPRGGPSVGSGRDQNAPAGTRSREFYISPERKQALIEAGVWDDPVLRARYVKKYAEYDKNNQA